MTDPVRPPVEPPVTPPSTDALAARALLREIPDRIIESWHPTVEPLIQTLLQRAWLQGAQAALTHHLTP